MTFRQLFKKIPLAFQMIGFLLLVGIPVGIFLHHRESSALKKLFLDRFSKHATEDASENRYIFNNYISTQVDSIVVLTENKNLENYLTELERNNWYTQENKGIRYYTRNLPPWFPSKTAVRKFVHPYYALLISPDTEVREVFQWSDKSPPDELLSLAFLPEILEHESLLTELNKQAFLLTFQDVRDSDDQIRAFVLFAWPIDNDFLRSVHLLIHKEYVGVVIDENHVIRATTNTIIADGTRISEYAEQYVSLDMEKEQTFFIDGNEQIALHLVLLMPRSEVTSTTEEVLARGLHWSLSFGMLCIVIAILLTWFISFRIRKITKEIALFFRKNLGFSEANYHMGDELHTLEAFFQQMTDNIIKYKLSLNTTIKELELDVLKRKKVEWALLKHTKEIERMNKELDDFTYIISHDLKEPLRSIEAFSKFVSTDFQDKLNDTGTHYLERIRANAGRMQKLIEDLLVVSRIGRKENVFEKVKINAILDDVLTRIEYTIHEKGVQMHIQEQLPQVFCDRVRLTEVFQNLISNAIKFADKQPPIIEIGFCTKEIYYEFFVRDNGPGIEKQYQEVVFNIFQRLEKRENYEGTGAGLTIVKKVIEMHKGKIWIESEEGKGTTFYFTLPKEKEIILGSRTIDEILAGENSMTSEEIDTALNEKSENES